MIIRTATHHDTDFIYFHFSVGKRKGRRLYIVCCRLDARRFSTVNDKHCGSDRRSAWASYNMSITIEWLKRLGIKSKRIFEWLSTWIHFVASSREIVKTTEIGFKTKEIESSSFYHFPRKKWKRKNMYNTKRFPQTSGERRWNKTGRCVSSPVYTRRRWSSVNLSKKRQQQQQTTNKWRREYMKKIERSEPEAFKSLPKIVVTLLYYYQDEGETTMMARPPQSSTHHHHHFSR